MDILTEGIFCIGSNVGFLDSLSASFIGVLRFA